MARFIVIITLLSNQGGESKNIFLERNIIVILLIKGSRFPILLGYVSCTSRRWSILRLS